MAGEEPRRPTVPVNVQQTTSVPSLHINENGGAHERDRKQESDSDQNGYVFNCILEDHQEGSRFHHCYLQWMSLLCTFYILT